MAMKGSMSWWQWESTRGERSKTAVLTDEIAMKIYLDPRPRKIIGEAYGTSESNVTNIKNKRRWRHIHKTPEERI